MRPSLRRLLAPLPDTLLRHTMYLRCYRRRGDFKDPTRFSEFLTQRMLHDRSPEIAWTCDKRAMKEYAAAHAPWINVPETLWRGTDLSQLDLSSLPERWVIKPNHGSNSLHFGDASTTLGELHEVTRGWLRPFDRIAVGEWAYTAARRELIVEPRIGAGRPLADFKLFVFHGELKLVLTYQGRFTDGLRAVFYNREWEPLDIRNGAPRGTVSPKPQNFEEMVRAAETLGAGYASMRVDFYNLDGDLWFSELTPYHGGGLDPFTPESVDRQLGAWWAGVGAIEELPEGLPRLLVADPEESDPRPVQRHGGLEVTASIAAIASAAAPGSTPDPPEVPASRSDVDSSVLPPAPTPARQAVPLER